ncbi:SMI1/KNR4 family protein [Streptomyces racemochromogenes]|uniref:SMI1/KNR4 family protein n=1 Tax=Streptomyces racemochromogenes TaxID=67353 RepID=A0ABW7P6P6_9ACTN
MNWRGLVLGLLPEAELAGPADEADLAEVERVLGQALPADLAGLLRECDGVVGRHATDVVWSARRIARDNAELRGTPELAALYMPFEPLMFFGDNGGGDLFGVVRTPERPDVFAWDHESDGRSWAAGGVEDYLRRALPAAGDWYRY